MRLALTGATGLVGRFILAEARAAGDDVTVFGRQAVQGLPHRPWRLGESPDLRGFDAVIHAAFDHLPGRYRGGEGDDPEGFLRRNLDGSATLFAAAARAGCRVVFLSSRAVYGPLAGALHEDHDCAPDTLYGQAKLAAERRLLSSGQPAVVLRPTGVYGPPAPGQAHKWTSLFADFAAGATVAPRVATELHGADLAAALRLTLAAEDDAAGRVFNVSDLVLDRRDLLCAWSEASGLRGTLPKRAEAGGLGVMATERLRGLGWTPGGWPALGSALAAIAKIPPQRETPLP